MSEARKKVLVLGANGFVGKKVIQILKDEKYEVIAASRKDFDLLNYEETNKNFKKINPDVIINCAAHTGSLHYVTSFAADVINDNLQTTLNVYRAVKESCKHAKVINPLSNCSYPGDAVIQKEGEYWNGSVHKSVLSYGNYKRAVAVISECYNIQFGIKSVNFLVPNAYGPGDYTDPNKTHALNGMIIRMIKAKKEGQKEFEIWGTGKPVREWAYVEDIAQLLVKAIEIDNQVAPINFAQNKSYSIAETAEMIKENLGFTGKLVFNTKYQDGAPRKQLDDELFKSKFAGFTFTEMNKGIKETIEYYQKHL